LIDLSSETVKAEMEIKISLFLKIKLTVHLAESAIELKLILFVSLEIDLNIITLKVVI